MLGLFLPLSNCLFYNGDNYMNKTNRFPYRTEKSPNFDEFINISQKLFVKSSKTLQGPQIINYSQSETTKINKNQGDEKIIMPVNDPIIPEPTQNPYMTDADITITTGILIQTTIATLSLYEKAINSSTTVPAYTETNKYTETFVLVSSTFTLTVSKVSEIIPTYIKFDSSTKTSIFTKSFTIGPFISTSHTKTVSNTQFLTYSRSESDADFTQSIAGYCAPGQITYSVTTTTFNTDTITEAFTQLDRTYTWTSGLTTIATYVITKPWSFTQTSVKKGVKVTISGNSKLTFYNCYGYDESVSFVDVLVNLTFPDPTPIPTISNNNYEEELVTFTITHISTATDVAQLKSAVCPKSGVVSTWTLSPMYTSTYVKNGKDFELMLTQTKVLLKAITEIGKSSSCFNVAIIQTNTLTNVITTTKVIQTFTETITDTISTYYKVKTINTNVVWESAETELVRGTNYFTRSMTDRMVLMGDENSQTFVKVFTETIVKTTATEYTTVITYTEVIAEGGVITYEPEKSDTTIQTVTLTFVKPEENLIRRSSACSNFFPNKSTSISSTIIYTYINYQTMVEYVNTGSVDVTVFELGEAIKTQIISVNPIESTVSTEVNTVTLSKGSTIVNPGDSITNSLLKTFVYTATYVDAKTDYDAFEDQCSFKQFTYSNTYSVFPVITTMSYDTVTKVEISNKELMKTNVPSTFFQYTYGYTILDSKATYILGEFIYSKMTETFISAGKDPIEILSVVHQNSQTATGSSTVSETIVDYIPIRTPFPTFSEELINPYYTKTTLTFTKATLFDTLSSTIYQRNTNYTISTLTNIMTSTTMFTETFYNSEKTVTYGYSTMDVLVPTQVDVSVGQVTTILTYHTVSTTYYTATHYLSETITQALTFSSSAFDKPKDTNVSSYSIEKTSFCYHSFKVTKPTSAYTYTEIYDTWQWTKIKESVIYTVTKLSDYTYVNVLPVNGKEITAYFASYSCTGTTSYYSNTEIISKVNSISTYIGKEYPKPSDFPTEAPPDEEITKMFIITNTFTNSIETYVTSLSSTVCESDIMTATLINTQTFKETYTISDKQTIYTYTTASTIAYTITHLRANSTDCNTYVISKTSTDTQIFTNTEVEVSGNDIFTESVLAINIPYIKASTAMTSSTLTNTVINLDLGKSSNVTTFTYADLLTFVQIGEMMTYTETFTKSSTTIELSGPTTATVLKVTSVNQFTTYSDVRSSTVVYSMIITQKSPQDMEIPVAQNPCMQFGTTMVSTNIQTYIETFSVYHLLVTYKNGYDVSTTVTDVGTINQVEHTMAAFFSTTTVVKTNTVVKLKSSAVVKPNSTITNSISSTYTLTQVYVDGATTYTLFTDICMVYGIAMKDTVIMLPTQTLTKAHTLVSTTVPVETPTDIEFVKLARSVYREGLTMYTTTPTRTFSLFPGYTYTSSFFKGPEAAISVFALQEMYTVVEKAVSTYTIVIGTPPPPDDDDGHVNNNLVYIIIGVVLGVAAIAAIIIVVMVRYNKKLTYIDQESDSKENILTADLLMDQEYMQTYSGRCYYNDALNLECSDT